MTFALVTTLPPQKDQVSVSLMLDFGAQTVQGFSSPAYLDVPLRITGMNDVTVSFRGSAQDFIGLTWTIYGGIDRVTGDLDANQLVTDKTGKTVTSTAYALKCKPTQRIF